MSGLRLFSVCLVAVVLIVGAGLVSGAVPLPRARDYARPPCEQLPNRQSVVDALASHEALVARIQGVGPGVKVDIATPCEGQPDRAIVRITYATDTEWEGVHSILREEGFGVAAELVSD